MSNGSLSENHSAAGWVGALSALGGVLVLVGAFFSVIRSYINDAAGESDVAWHRWQALGMLVVSVGIAYGVAAMLRFALSPLVGQQQPEAEIVRNDRNTMVVGVVSAFGGFVTLVVAFFYLIWGGRTANPTSVERWQALGMLVVVASIAFGVTAMLRFAMQPLLGSKPTGTSAPAATAADVDTRLRGRMAVIVLSVGSTAIVVLAVTLIIVFAALATRNDFTDLRTRLDTLLPSIFGIVLPVLATWVGTVLAFYFGTESFRQAAQSTREVLSDRLVRRQKITDVMIPYVKIAKLPAKDADAASKTPLRDVIHTLSEAATRLILFKYDTQTPIYVIRSDRQPLAGWITNEFQANEEFGKKDKPEGAILVKNYLDEDDNRKDATNFSFIAGGVTIEDALIQMARESVDDLFITQDGSRASPVLGWVTARDLRKGSLREQARQ